MQSIFLIAAYIAGHNKDSIDSRMFSFERKKFIQRKSKKDNKNNVGIVGKTKKFGIERIFAIVDYFVSLLA